MKLKNNLFKIIVFLFLLDISNLLCDNGDNKKNVYRFINGIYNKLTFIKTVL